VWGNFISMPLLLKLLTVHALSCVLGLINSVFPRGTLHLYGHAATYAEWWSSGAGVYFAALGIAGPIVGVLFLRKSRYCRQAYLGFLILALVVPYVAAGSPAHTLITVAVICTTMAYLYKWWATKEYFAP